MGYALAIAPCLVCRNTFSFNPLKVPSLSVGGSRQPICERCMGIINQRRIEAGVEPFTIQPDAYEACDEQELD